MSAQVVAVPLGGAQRGSTPDVLPPGPATAGSSSEATEPAAFVTSYLEAVGEGCAGLPPMPPEQAAVHAEHVPAEQQPAGAAAAAAAAACSAGVLHPTPAMPAPQLAYEQAFRALVEAPLRSAVQSGGAGAAPVMQVGPDGAITGTFGDPTPAAGGIPHSSAMHVLPIVGMPAGEAPVVGQPLGLQVGVPLMAAAAAVPSQPSADQVGGIMESMLCNVGQQEARPAKAPRHNVHGIEEAPPGSGHYKLYMKVNPHQFRVAGYKSAALAAVAYDHVRLWQSLQRSKAGVPPDAPPPSPDQLAAHVEGDVAATNFSVETYTGERAQHALLIKLHSMGPQQLRDHLQPHVLEEWAAPQLREAAGSDDEGEEGEDADELAGGTEGGVSSAAALRRDNTTSFVGVSRVSNSSSMAAAINVCGKREHLGSFDSAVEAAVVRDIGVIWKNLHGYEGTFMLNLPRLGLDKDEVLLEQLREAEDVESLKEVLARWVAEHLRDAVECLQVPQAGCGQRAALVGLANVLQEAGGTAAARPGLAAATNTRTGQEPAAGAAVPSSAGAGSPAVGSSGSGGQLPGAAADGQGEGQQEMPAAGSNGEGEGGVGEEEGEGSGEGGSGGKQGPATEVRRCAHCGDTETSAFRRHPVSQQLLCAACISYWQRTGTHRPAELIQAIRRARAAGWTGPGRVPARFFPGASSAAGSMAARCQRPARAQRARIEEEEEETEPSSDEEAGEEAAEEEEVQEEEKEEEEEEQEQQVAAEEEERQAEGQAEQEPDAEGQAEQEPQVEEEQQDEQVADGQPLLLQSQKQQEELPAAQQPEHPVQHLPAEGRRVEQADVPAAADAAEAANAPPQPQPQLQPDASQGAAAVLKNGAYSWQDAEHTRLEKLVSAEETAARSVILPEEVWRKLFSVQQGQVLLRHGETDHRLHLDGTHLQAPEVFQQSSLLQGTRILLHSEPADVAGSPRGSSRSRGRSVGQTAAGKLPVVSLRILKLGGTTAPPLASEGGSAPPVDSGAAGQQRRCTECGTTKAQQWRRHPEGLGHSLCDTCGKRAWQLRRQASSQHLHRPGNSQELQRAEPPPLPQHQGSSQQQQQRQGSSQRLERPEPPQQAHPLPQLRQAEQPQRQQQQQPGSSKSVQPLGSSQQLEQAGQQQEEHQASQQQQQQQQQTGCSNCGVQDSNPWRLHPATGERLCVRCRQWMDRHDGQLPALGSEQPVCSHCGADCRAGNRQYRHPATGKRLCGHCRMSMAKRGGQLPPLPGQLHQQEEEDGAEVEEGQLGGEQQQEADAARKLPHWGHQQGRQPRARGQRKNGWAQAPVAADSVQVEEQEVEEEQQVEEEEQQVEEEQQGEEQLCCTHCGAQQAGPTLKSRWGKHYLSGQRLCASCFKYSKANNNFLPEQPQPVAVAVPATAQEQQQRQHAEPPKPAAEGKQKAVRPSQQQQEAGEAGAGAGPDEQPEAGTARGQEPEQRHCLQCGSTQTARQWHSHPATGARWLCSRCFSPARTEWKRQQRQQVQEADEPLRARQHPHGGKEAQQEQQANAPQLPGGGRQQEQQQPEKAKEKEVKDGEAENEVRRAGQEAHKRPVREEESQGQRICTHCGTSSSTLWRRHPSTKARLCNRCGQFARTHDGQLPSLRGQAEEDEEPGEEEGKEDGGEAEEQQQEQRICTHCGTSSSTLWRRHPSTKVRLCDRCGQFARRHDGQLPLLHGHAEEVEDEEGEGAPEEAEEERDEGQQEQRICSHCGTSSSTLWRRHPSTKARLCNRCGTFARRHDGQLPLLQEAEESEEEQQQQPQEPAQRQCLECGTDQGGRSWHSHPATGARWLCDPCFNRARSALHRQQKQQQAARGKGRRRQAADLEQEKEDAAAAPQLRSPQQQTKKQRQAQQAAAEAAATTQPVVPRSQRQQAPAAQAVAAQAAAMPASARKRTRQQQEPEAGEQPLSQQPLSSGELAAPSSKRSRRAPAPFATTAAGSGQAAGAPQEPASPRAQRRQQAERQQQAPKAVAGSPVGVGAAASPAAAAVLAAGARGKGGGPCMWVDAKRTALQVEVTDFCMKNSCLRIQSAMAAKLAALPSGGSVSLLCAADASGASWQVELQKGSVDAKELFQRLDVRAGDQLLLQRRTPPGAPQPLLAVAKLAPGKEAADVLTAMLNSVQYKHAAGEPPAAQQAAASERPASRAAASPAPPAAQPPQQAQQQQAGSPPAAGPQTSQAGSVASGHQQQAEEQRGQQEELGQQQEGKQAEGEERIQQQKQQKEQRVDKRQQQEQEKEQHRQEDRRKTAVQAVATRMFRQAAHQPEATSTPHNAAAAAAQLLQARRQPQAAAAPAQPADAASPAPAAAAAAAAAAGQPPDAESPAPPIYAPAAPAPRLPAVPAQTTGWARWEEIMQQRQPQPWLPAHQHQVPAAPEAQQQLLPAQAPAQQQEQAIQPQHQGLRPPVPPLALPPPAAPHGQAAAAAIVAVPPLPVAPPPAFAYAGGAPQVHGTPSVAAPSPLSHLAALQPASAPLPARVPVTDRLAEVLYSDPEAAAAGLTMDMIVHFSDYCDGRPDERDMKISLLHRQLDHRKYRDVVTTLGHYLDKRKQHP